MEDLQNTYNFRDHHKICHSSAEEHARIILGPHQITTLA